MDKAQYREDSSSSDDNDGFISYENNHFKSDEEDVPVLTCSIELKTIEQYQFIPYELGN